MRSAQWTALAWHRLLAIRHALSKGETTTNQQVIHLAFNPPASEICPPPALPALEMVPRAWVKVKDGAIALRLCGQATLTLWTEAREWWIKAYGSKFRLMTVLKGLEEGATHPFSDWLRRRPPHPSEVFDAQAWFDIPPDGEFPASFWLSLLKDPHQLIQAAKDFAGLDPRDIRAWWARGPDYALLAKYGHRLSKIKVDVLKNAWLLGDERHYLEGNCPVYDADRDSILMFRRAGHKMAIPRLVRDIHPYDAGRLCPLTTSEGENVGRMISLAAGAGIHPAGYILTADELRGEMGELPLFYRPPFEPYRANHRQYAYQEMLGRIASSIPFVNFNDPARATMGVGMLRQAMPLIAPAPRVVKGRAPDAEIEQAIEQVQSPALVAYLCMPDATFEDGLLVSENFASDGRFAALRRYRYRLSRTQGEHVGKLLATPLGTWIDTDGLIVLKEGDDDEGAWIVRHQGAAGQLWKIEQEDDGYSAEIISIAMPRVGDKLAGLHGNKGVIAKIKAESDMLTLPNGRSIDICFSPISVLSRLNIGQLFEAHLGWAGWVTGRKYVVSLDQGGLRAAVYAELAHAWRMYHYANYGLSVEDIISKSKYYSERLKFLSWEEIKLRVEDLPDDLKPQGPTQRHLCADNAIGEIDQACGLYARMTCSDLPSEASLENRLAWCREIERYGWPSPLGGRMWLRPRKGAPCRGMATVGVVNIVRLAHLAVDKLSARSIGGYSSKHMQPLRGRRRNGGQRLGEMEIWTLLAHHAIENIQEVISVKSDYAASPSSSYTALVSGRFDEREYRSLGLQRLIAYMRTLGIGIREVDHAKQP